jgi:hypothetical protein
MENQLDIPNAHLLDLVVDETAQSDVFKSVLANDINICISRVNTELQTKREDTDVDFYRSMLRLIRRISESEGFDFIEPQALEKVSNSLIH